MKFPARSGRSGRRNDGSNEPYRSEEAVRAIVPWCHRTPKSQISPRDQAMAESADHDWSFDSVTQST
jgi:hypothetical protein